MSYQPYPGGGSYQPYPGGGSELAERPPRPRSVQIAVWLMYGGAALSALLAILIIAISGRIESAVRKAAVKANATAVSEGKKALTTSQINTLSHAIVVVLVVILLIGVALWAWMAWANGRGRNWARIVATVLFVLNTLYFLLVVTRAGSSALFVGLDWLVGLGAIIMLWRRESAPYFKPLRP